MKHLLIQQSDLENLWFPRLLRRGPIEAVVRIEYGEHIIRPFPRLLRRGPIEAWILPTSCASRRRFPRLLRRGPIEAPYPII